MAMTSGIAMNVRVGIAIRITFSKVRKQCRLIAKLLTFRSGLQSHARDRKNGNPYACVNVT
eukprot:2267994-Prorocentrum_lima.AAC.1